MTKVVHLAPVHQVLDMRVFQKECKTLAKAGYEVVMVTSYGNNETIDGVRIHTVHKPKNVAGISGRQKRRCAHLSSAQP
jgi:hypothetical protein